MAFRLRHLQTTFQNIPKMSAKPNFKVVARHGCKRENREFKPQPVYGFMVARDSFKLSVQTFSGTINLRVKTSLIAIEMTMF